MKIKIEFEGRLDQVLSNQLNLSRSKISQIIKEGILLNSKKIDKPSTKVKIGDLVEFEYTEVDLSKITPVKIDFNILYEDEYLMVVNKPRGLVVHPSSGHYQDSLANGLAYYFNKDNESMDDEFRMGIVHRIDKDTSGLLIVAKTLLAKQKLSEMISKHLVDRQYFALAYGFFSNKNQGSSQDRHCDQQHQGDIRIDGQSHDKRQHDHDRRSYQHTDSHHICHLNIGDICGHSGDQTRNAEFVDI